MRPINADDVLDKMKSTFDMQELYLPIHLKELIIDDMPTIPAIVIPDGVTNGEVIQSVFPDADLINFMGTITVDIPKHGAECRQKIRFGEEWWNAPYKKEG